MISLTDYRASVGKVLAIGLLLAALHVVLLSPFPADAAVTSGKAYGWGYNYYGELGNGTSGPGTDKNVPGAVVNLTGVKSVKAGCDHGLALKTDGTVRAWGDNRAGQLGNDTIDDSDVPVRVRIENVKAISAGCSHNLALKENGTVWAWGGNNHGQLGNDTSGSYSDVPVKVASLGTGAKAIAAGNEFSLALMKDGTVRSWGDNQYGQLGNGGSGPAADRDVPVVVKNLAGVKAIATDSFAQHALALLDNGTVKSWGAGHVGQLGDGSYGEGAFKTTPVKVANLSGVEAVAAGGYHSLALMGSGRVKAWGGNYFGQLGDGTHDAGTDRRTPGNVIGLDNVRSISAGAGHSLAVLQSGRARSWGENQNGELGNGDEADSDVPVAVKNLTEVRSIDGGYTFTLAVAP